MSDFLARLAARAVGEPSVARPKLPAAFADAEPTTMPSLKAIEEDEVVLDRRPPQAAASDEAPSSAPPLPPGEQSPRDDGDTAKPSASLFETRDGDDPFVEPALAGAAPHDGAAEGPGAPPQRPPVSRPDAPEAGEAERAQLHLPERAPSRAPRSARAVPAVRAESVAAAERPPRPSAAAAPARAPEEPAPVRVHIGRLEVRATLEQPREREHVPRRPSAAPELSLADYLRGKREAG